jgi:type IV pilus assembly protein PilM
VVSIETETLSIIRGVFKEDYPPTSIIMNFGTMTTTLAIVQAGVIVFTYTIPLGGVALTRAIASDFGLSLDQAEEYKKTYGLSDKNLSGKVGKSIEPIFTNIIMEVKKAIAFYNEKYKNESPISQLILAGATANLPGIDVFFVKNIGIETVIANPFKMLNINGVPNNLQNFGPEYAVACGLALKEYE